MTGDTVGDTRVLVAFPYQQSPSSGGPNSVAYNTVEGLKKRHDRLESAGIEIIVLSSQGESVRPRRVPDPEYSQLSYVYYDPVRPHAVTGGLQSLLRHRLLDGEIDLVHSHTLYDAVGSTLLGRKTLLTIHGIVWQEKHHIEGPYSKLKFRLKERRIERLSRRVNRIVAISPYVVEAVQNEFGVAEEAFSLVENPISDDFFELEDQTDGALVFCPGVVSQRKNQLGLVRALERLQREGVQFRVVFTGSISDADYLRSVEAAAVKAGVRGQIEFAGNVPREELLDLYERASVVCLFSLQETAPMVVAEAMASGTPVVAPDVGGIEYMIRDGVDGYVVPPNDEEMLAARLDRLLSDEELRSRFGENAREEASRWRCEHVAEDLIRCYEQFVRGGPES